MSIEIPRNRVKLPGCKLASKPQGGIVEEAIREAMDRGDFDNLPGKGKPLKLEGNSKDEKFLANKLLKDAGYVPVWLDLEREIKRERAECEKRIARFRDRYLKALRIVTEQSDDASRVRATIMRERIKVQEEHRTRLNALAKKVLRFNLLVPLKSRQIGGIKVEDALQAFEEEFPLL